MGPGEVRGRDVYTWEAEVWVLLQGEELRSGFGGLWKILGTKEQGDPKAKGGTGSRAGNAIGNTEEWRVTAGGTGKGQLGCILSRLPLRVRVPVMGHGSRSLEQGVGQKG